MKQKAVLMQLPLKGCDDDGGDAAADWGDDDDEEDDEEADERAAAIEDVDDELEFDADFEKK